MSKKKIFEDFIAWQKRTGVELPDSEFLMPMFESYYTPEEAEFLTGFPIGLVTIEQLAEIKNMDPAELPSMLKNLSEKGMVVQSFTEDMVRYRMADTIFALLRGRLWNLKDDDPMKSTAPWTNKYFAELWEQFRHDSERALRAIPIDKTIEAGTSVLPFEDIVKVIDDREYYTVSDCPCRVRFENDPDYQDCDYPKAVCLHFDDLGRYCVENGLGREITRDETLAILKKAADAGLIHGIMNQEENPDTI